MTKGPQETRLQGSPICPGIAIGEPFIFIHVDDEVTESNLKKAEISSEVKRYRKAIEKSRRDVQRMQQALEAEGAADGAAILDTHLQILKDPLINGHVEDEIHGQRRNAEYLLNEVIQQVSERFAAMKDPFFRERYRDFQDVYRRIMRHLRLSEGPQLCKLPSNSIVFAEELAPSDTAEADSQAIGAFVTATGGVTSHAAIVAKAKGIPYVASVNFDSIDEENLQLVIVDGRTGDVICNPTKETLEQYRLAKRQMETQYKALETASALSAETYDGYKVDLSANVEMVKDLDSLHKYGSSGVGLFRSEYMCLSKEDFPPEYEQFLIYRRLVDKMRGLPVVIRTFDISGDKLQMGGPMRVSENTAGNVVRGLTPEHRDVFKTQIRAILRASAFGDVSILFPMVSGLRELRDAKNLVAESRKELEAEGVPVGKRLRLGCMIEVPSAAIVCDVLAKECDFLSIGTNDLVQYSLALDRCTTVSDDSFSPTHPSVIRMIKMVVSEGARNKISVKVCGEVAADPQFTTLLLGLGVRELSVAPRHIPILKYAIRNTGIVAATELAERVLSLSTGGEIAEVLAEEYQRTVPDLHLSST